MSKHVSDRQKLISEIVTFFQGEEGDIGILCDFLLEDLRIDYIDCELSQLCDSITDKKYDISFEDIVRATLKRVIMAVESFEDDPKLEDQD